MIRLRGIKAGVLRTGASTASATKATVVTTIMVEIAGILATYLSSRRTSSTGRAGGEGRGGGVWEGERDGVGIVFVDVLSCFFVSLFSIFSLSCVLCSFVFFLQFFLLLFCCLFASFLLIPTPPPPTPKQEGDRMSKQFLCDTWKKRNEHPNVGDVY